MLERLFTTLFRTLLRPDGDEDALPDARVRVIATERTQLWGADGISMIWFGWVRYPSLSPCSCQPGSAVRKRRARLLSAFSSRTIMAARLGFTAPTHSRADFASRCRSRRSRSTVPPRRGRRRELFDTLPRWEALERGA